MLRKFSIWLLKNIIVLLIATLIFSAIAVDIPSLAKNLFSDVFQYASPEMQKEVTAKLTSSCSNFKDFQDIEKEMSTRSPLLPDLRKIAALCKDYNGGKINDKEFFYSVVENTLPNKLPQAGFFEKYNSIVTKLNKNKAFYFIILVFLLILLSLLAGSIEKFLSILGDICLGIGLLILIPYIAVFVYDKFIGIDTTSILSTIIGGNLLIDAKAIISIILLMMLRTYTDFIIVVGLILFIAGIISKIYAHKSKKITTTTLEAKKEKKNKEQEKEEKSSKDVKSILDELESMGKKEK